MIDVGFAGHDGGFIDLYFVTLIGIGLVLALASAVRMYAVNWLGERVVADMRAQVFGHLATLGPAFYETTHSGEVMSRLTADTTQIKVAAGSALSQALRNAIMLVRRAHHDVRDQPAAGGAGAGGHPADRVSAAGLRPRRAPPVARRAGPACRRLGLCRREPLRRVRTMHAFGQEETVSRRFAGAVELAFEAARARLMARAGLTAIAISLVVIEHRRHPVVRLAPGDRRRDHRRPPRPVRALCGVRGGAIAELSEVWGELAQAAGAAERLLELLAVRPEIVRAAAPKAFAEPPQRRVALPGRALRLSRRAAVFRRSTA